MGQRVLLEWGSETHREGRFGRLMQELWGLGSPGIYSVNATYLKIETSLLLTKVHIVKAMFFPAVMYGCKSWTIKKAEL